MIDSSTNLINTASNKPHNYHEQSQIDQTLRLREVLKTLPPFAKDYFRAMEPKSSARTRINYAYDIRVFFHFLMENNPVYKNYTMDRFMPRDLENLEPVDIEEYQEYLKVYEASSCDKQITNGERGLKRKMSALRSFYTYYYKRQVISSNPTLLVDMPKIHEKSIIRLEANETAALLDYIEHAGDQLSGQKKAYYEKTKTRDLALITLLLGTGIRVSECVGLDIEDVDFKNNGIKVTRKGGNEMVVYFGPEVEKALKSVKISFLWKVMSTLSSTLRSVVGSVCRQLRILSKNMRVRSQLPKRSRRISSAVPMARHFIRKQVIFIWLRMFLAIKT